MRLCFGITLLTVALLRGAQSDTARYEKYLLEGMQLQKEKRYHEADKAYSRALDEAERQFGSEHFSVADVLDHVGALRTVQGDYSAARAAFERSLSISEKSLIINETTFGPQHFSVGLILTNIAMIYHQQQRYGTAEPLYRRARALWDRRTETRS